MIAIAGLALQLAAAAPPAAGSFVVRDANRSISVPLVATANGPMLRLESLNPLLAVDVKRGNAGTYAGTVSGIGVAFDMGSAVVRIKGEPHQLAEPPLLRSGRLMVPLQFVSDLVP